ncbi:MAG: 50S ribosomal protein L25 [Opitutales bacterium]
MKELQLNVTKREATGRGSSRRLRKSGQIPAVLYGPSGSQPIQVTNSEFRQLWREIMGTTALIDIRIGDSEGVRSIIKDIQRDPLTDGFTHIDFNEVPQGVEMTAEIPVHLHGEAVGVKNAGGVLEQMLHEVEVRCLPRFLPSDIEIEIGHLKIGDSLHISDLPKLDGVEYMNEPEQMIVSISEPRVEEEPEPAEDEDVDVPVVGKEDEASDEDESDDDDQGKKEG